VVGDSWHTIQQGSTSSSKLTTVDTEVKDELAVAGYKRI